MGDLNTRQKTVLDELREWVNDNNFNANRYWDDYDLLRYCRARKFNIQQVKLMFQNMVEWRYKNQIDAIVPRFQRNKVDVKRVFKHYEGSFHGVDK